MKSKQLIVLSASMLLVFGVFAMPLGAQTATTSTTTLSQIQTLLEQIKVLQAKLTEIQNQQSGVQSELNQSLQLFRQLSVGMSGEDVKLLQEILATDPSLYPERLVTGFYGPLTEKAVKKFQEEFGIDPVGRVGPMTLSRLNTLLTQGAGNSGKVPPGLLIAPGIAKKLGYTPTVPVNQTLPPGIAKKIAGRPVTQPDTVAPNISNVASTTASSTASVTWNTNEIATSTIWFGPSSSLSASDTATATSTTLVMSHKFEFSNLATSTTYYFLMRSVDQAGNATTSVQYSLKTLAE